MKKLLTLIAFALVTFTANAQAYDYEYELSKSGWHECHTNDAYDIPNTISGYYPRIWLHLSSKKEMYCIPEFDIISRDLDPLSSITKTKNFSIQLKLSNGYTLKSNTDNYTIKLLRWGVVTDKMIINNKEYRGDYIMSLLRTYDIIAITIEGTTIKTPGLRSADTFDAMCKTLIAKTGDQGQYGKRLTNNNNNASNAQKPQTPTTSKPTNKTQQNNAKPNTSNNSSKPNTSNSQSSSINVDLNKMNATTLKAEAEKGNHEAMYILGCRYHDGQLAGIEKNDRLSYQWLMTYCHVSNEKDGEKAIDYIKNNLKRNHTTLNPSFEYLTKETNLTPMDFILHPLAYFPTSAIFMKEANMEREITTKRQMTISTSYKKKFDKGKIDIWERGNLGKMPKLLNKEVWKMEWSSKNKKYATYDFDFHFGNRNEAETFLYTIAYETMQEGVFWEKSGYKTPRKIDENIDFGYTTYLTIKGKRYYVPITLYLFDIKNAKPEERYTIAIHVSLVQSK